MAARMAWRCEITPAENSIAGSVMLAAAWQWHQPAWHRWRGVMAMAALSIEIIAGGSKAICSWRYRSGWRKLMAAARCMKRGGNRSMASAASGEMAKMAKIESMAAQRKLENIGAPGEIANEKSCSAKENQKQRAMWRRKLIASVIMAQSSGGVSMALAAM